MASPTHTSFARPTEHPNTLFQPCTRPFCNYIAFVEKNYFSMRLLHAEGKTIILKMSTPFSSILKAFNPLPSHPTPPSSLSLCNTVAMAVTWFALCALISSPMRHKLSLSLSPSPTQSSQNLAFLPLESERLIVHWSGSTRFHADPT